MIFKKARIIKKRFQSLLEVLIAFVLIVLCILPLVYPHVAMYRAQIQFVKQIELDHVVNLLYARILEKLYMNAIPWNDLEREVFPIDDGLLKEIQYEGTLNYTGTYNFFEKKPRFKPKKKGSPLSIYLFHLTFNFAPKGFQKTPDTKKIKKYQYDVFIVRDLKAP